MPLPDLEFCRFIPLSYHHPFRQSRGLQGISELTSDVRKICHEEQVKMLEVSFYDRRTRNRETEKWGYGPVSEDEEDDVTLTCIVFAQKSNVDKKWINIARKAYRFLEEKGLNNFRVEIIDLGLSKIHVYPSPCSPQDAIYSQWGEICREFLKKISLEGIKAVGCYRLGAGYDVSNYAPNVIVDVHPNETRDWKVVREEILQILIRHGINMVVFDKWRDFGVQVTDKDAGAILLVDSPSQEELTTKIKGLERCANDYQKSINRLQARTDEDVVDGDDSRDEECKQMQESISLLHQECDDFRSLYKKESCVLGAVFAASGLVQKPLATIHNMDPTASLSMIDWALIKIEKRAPGTNSSPNLPEFHQKLSCLARDGYIQLGKRLGKFGHATGHTMGTIRSLDTIRDLFAPGDEGTLVYDHIGQVHGTCRGGNLNGDIAYFTHIADLTADIRQEIPGLQNIRVLGSEF
ncbi:uncharacterized protein KD926_007619 [Aspergillus affinis]|uniref:uncharacterized protein n=1 Tax=Aspergillus affinis TaxID=1070780 RepID=UPI0022FECEBA|nr:uncharacterized protein KD926_007619 [Aspergillus affinis]KAI9040811.1 hypothetical protein KD926_007619 [Aspergillus affinis]